jgi:hypothetical protein
MALEVAKYSTCASSAGRSITTASLTINQNEKILVLMITGQSGTSGAGGATVGGQTTQQANSTHKATASPEASVEPG